MDHYGIRGDANNLISSYLHNRKQYVLLPKWGELWSKICGPGGTSDSILGPLLYVMYVNDLPNAIDSTSKLYADDMCLIVHDAIVTKLEQKFTINL